MERRSSASALHHSGTVFLDTGTLWTTTPPRGTQCSHGQGSLSCSPDPAGITRTRIRWGKGARSKSNCENARPHSISTMRADPPPPKHSLLQQEQSLLQERSEQAWTSVKQSRVHLLTAVSRLRAFPYKCKTTTHTLRGWMGSHCPLPLRGLLPAAQLPALHIFLLWLHFFPQLFIFVCPSTHTHTHTWSFPDLLCLRTALSSDQQTQLNVSQCPIITKPQRSEREIVE